MDKHKLWLVVGIILTLVVVLFLVFYPQINLAGKSVATPPPPDVDYDPHGAGSGVDTQGLYDSSLN